MVTEVSKKVKRKQVDDLLMQLRKAKSRKLRRAIWREIARIQNSG